MIKDLFKFSEIKKNVNSRPLAFYFALDNSGSMTNIVPGTGLTRFEILITQIKTVVSNLSHLKSSKNTLMDIGFCTFDDILIKRDFQPFDVFSIELWLDSLVADQDTPFDVAIGNARDYYTDMLNPFTHTQVMFFVTDGEPFPLSSAQTAYDENTDMIESTGVFAVNPVDMYGINIELTDTTYIELVTNQPPSVVDPAEPDVFLNLIYGIIEDTINTTVGITTLTSADFDETYDDDIYTAVTMGRNNAELKSELAKSNLQISFSIDNEFAKKWLNETDVFLLLDLFEKDTDVDEVLITWKGRLNDITINGNKIILKFESVFSSLRRFGLNRIYQRTCSYSLFGYGCTLYRGDFEDIGTVIGITSDGLGLTTSGLVTDNDYFTYGSVQNEAGTSRFISSQIGNLLILSKASHEFVDDFNASGPFSIKVYPGCIKSKNACETKFNNVINFGGFPFMPVKNPFERIKFI